MNRVDSKYREARVCGDEGGLSDELTSNADRNEWELKSRVTDLS